MDHNEYRRMVQGSKNAVLLIHGIAGTPAHFRDLLPVIPEDWSVHNLLLDGHSKGVLDFGRSSMKTWKVQVKDALEALLSAHERVYVVAHSMGTLFSIQAAIDHPDRIVGLFLLAVPTRPLVRFSTVLTSLRVVFGDRISPAARAMYQATGIEMDWRFWRYATWVPRLLELLTECRRTRKLLPQLAVPTMTFQSRIDELVSLRACKDLEANNWIRNTVLEHSGHFAYGAEDNQFLQKQLANMLQTK